MKAIIIFSLAICIALSVSAQTEKFSSVDCIPVPAVCYPLPLDTPMLGIGISYVSFGQIQNTSGQTSFVFENYTCTDFTLLNTGTSYTFQVTTGQTYEESVTAWIDFDNDGDFAVAEIVFHDSAVVYTHQGTITIPTGIQNQNMPIRMRVGSDASGPQLTGCNQPVYGEYEDYKVYYGLNISVAENDQHLYSSVFPNPMQSSARIEFNGNKSFLTSKMELCIYNCIGGVVSRKEVLPDIEVTIERGTLAKGLYFFELRNSLAEKTSGKFMIE